MNARAICPLRTVTETICQIEGVHKAFGGVQALHGVDLAIRSGEIHAILGENGAGKSTLVKVIAGAEHPDQGIVRLHGVERHFTTSAEAASAGVQIVFQEFSLFPDLDVLSNMFVGGMPTRLGLVSRREMRRTAERVLREIGLDIDVDQPVELCTLAERQLIEIAKALLQHSDILILDEPNSALSAIETERLMAVVRHLRSAGVAVVYISHRLEEVFDLADKITVMRNGQVVATAPIVEWSIDQAVEAMLGREASHIEELSQDHVETPKLGHSAVTFERVTVHGAIEDISFTIAKGEVVGLAGLDGSGARKVLSVIFGMIDIDTGNGYLGTNGAIPTSPYHAVRRGVAYVPADRKTDGVMLEQSVSMNINQVSAGTLGRLGFGLPARRLDERAQDEIEGLGIVTKGPATPVNNLSGGNQQKVVLAKWLEARPSVVLLDDPTRGVDVGAKSQIYSLVTQLAHAGQAILFTSTELGEYSRVCDRVLVFRQGRLVGEIRGSVANEHVLLEAVNSWQ